MESLIIEVTDANGTPLIQTVADQTISVGEVKDIAIVATDPDGDPLQLIASNLPRFATLQNIAGGTATLRLAPQRGDRGNYPITLRATDNGGGDPLQIRTGQFTFILTVESLNEPP